MKPNQKGIHKGEAPLNEYSIPDGDFSEKADRSSVFYEEFYLNRNLPVFRKSLIILFILVAFLSVCEIIFSYSESLRLPLTGVLIFLPVATIAIAAGFSLRKVLHLDIAAFLILCASGAFALYHILAIQEPYLWAAVSAMLINMAAYYLIKPGLWVSAISAAVISIVSLAVILFFFPEKAEFILPVILLNATGVFASWQTENRDRDLFRADSERRRQQIDLMAKDDNILQIAGRLKTEIREVKKFRKKLDALKEKYRLLLERTHDAVVLLRKGRMVFFNNRMLNITGFDRSILYEKNFIDFVDERDRGLFESALNGISAYSLSETVTIRFKNEYGNPCWLDTTISRLSAEGENSYLLFLKDVSGFMGALEKLQETEDKYKLIIGNSTDVIMISQESKVKFFNDKASELTGYSAEELGSMYFSELIHPDDKEILSSSFKNAGTSEQLNADTEFKILAKDGSEKYIRSRSIPINWKNRPAIMHFMKDVSEIKRIKQQLEKDESFYKDVFMSSAAAGAIIDENSIIQSVNSKFLEISGFAAQELEGKMKLTELIGNGGTISSGNKENSQEPESLKFGPGTFTMKSREGDVRDILLISSELKEENYYLAVIIDVSGFKTTEREYFDFIEQYKEIIDNAQDAVYFEDEEGRIREPNKAACEMLGYSMEEMCEMKVNEILPEIHGKQLQSYKIRSASPGLYVEREVRKKDGRKLWAEISVTQVSFRGSERSLVFLRDITDRKIAEIALRESEEKYKTLFESYPDGLIISDQEGKLLDANGNFFSMTGYQRKKLGEMNLKGLSLRTWDEDSLEELKQNSSISFETELVTADGSIIPVNIYSWIIGDDNQGAGKIGSFLRDISDRKKTEKVLLESEEKYKALIASLPDLVLLARPDGEVLYTNTLCKYFLASDLIKMDKANLYEFLNNSNEKVVRENIEKSLAGEDTSNFEIQLESPSGDDRVFIASNSVIHFEDNLAILMVLRDITQRKQDEKKLRRLSAAFRTSLDTILLMDSKGFISDINKSGISLLRAESDSMVRGLNFLDFSLPGQRDIVEKHIQQVLESGASRFEFVLNAFDEKQTEVEAGLVAIRNELDETTGLVGILRDISERKVAEKAIRESEAKFRAVFEQSAENIFIMDYDTNRIIEANPKIQKELGYSLEELRRMKIFEFIDHDPNEIQKNINIVTHDGAIFLKNRRYTRKDGSCFDVEVSGTSIIYGGSRALCVVSRDITERLKAEEEIRNLNHELEDRVNERTGQLQKTLEELKEEIIVRKNAEKELMNARDEIDSAYRKEKELSDLKSRFISTISHEYRTPLTVILTSSYLMEQIYNGQRREKFEKHLKKIRNSVQVMTRLLENVLTIGKSEADKIQAKIAVFDIRELLDEVIEEASVMDHGRHDFRIRNEMEHTTIATDKMLLKQIINNLVSNAMLYSPDNTSIVLELDSDENDNLIFKVEDKGWGIDEKDREMVFDAFYRGEKALNISGTGLGLTIVKKCVDVLKGEISISNSEKPGTTVKVVIPINS